MKYQYKCPKCSKEIEIEKSMKDSNRFEYCECGRKLKRVYSISVKTGDGFKS